VKGNGKEPGYRRVQALEQAQEYLRGHPEPGAPRKRGRPRLEDYEGGRATTKQRRLQWSKFYWQDWINDRELSACSLAARGLWIDLLARMIVSGDGSSITGTVAQLAQLTRSPSPKAFLGCLVELKEHGVADVFRVHDRRGVDEAGNVNLSHHHQLTPVSGVSPGNSDDFTHVTPRKGEFVHTTKNERRALANAIPEDISPKLQAHVDNLAPIGGYPVDNPVSNMGTDAANYASGVFCPILSHPAPVILRVVSRRLQREQKARISSRLRKRAQRAIASSKLPL